MKHLSLELEKGELIWIPKTVMFEGKVYPAPLDLLPILYRRIIYDYLKNK